MEQKNARGCSAIPSQPICTNAIPHATRAGPRKRLSGFRNRKIAARPVKEQAYIIPAKSLGGECIAVIPLKVNLDRFEARASIGCTCDGWLGHLKRALGMEQRLTLQQSYELLLLAEAIMDFGRMVHAYERLSTPLVIVEIPELAHRFRETPQTIKNALRLLKDSGRAEPTDLSGCWKLDLARLSARDDLPAA